MNQLASVFIKNLTYAGVAIPGTMWFQFSTLGGSTLKVGLFVHAWVSDAGI